MKHLVTLSALLLSACSLLTPQGATMISPAEQSAWNQATKTNTPKSYQAYLKQFPNGYYAAAANRNLRTPAPAVTLSAVPAVGNNKSGRSDGGNGGSSGRSSGY